MPRTKNPRPKPPPEGGTGPLPDIHGVQFRLVDGFACYAVGTDGSVWSNLTKSGSRLPGWHRLSLTHRKSRGVRRYLLVSLRADEGRGKLIQRYVHRLVLEAFVGPCPPGMEGCHNDGNPLNNTPSNLRWDTHAANHADTRRHGTMPVGERHKNSKLTDEAVREIRRLRETGWDQNRLAAHFGVGQTVISGILRGKGWAHVV